MSLELGTLDGRVELRELLGQGGMGEVYAAWDVALQRAVAVKFVRGSDPRDAERLLLEARLQARVEHAHVVRVFEVGTLGGRPCILFQLVQGRPLDVLAATLTIAERVELVRQAATGLHAAHLEGLVHRDVKPGNVLVETPEEGARTAYVTDFGLAHAEEGGLTRSGILPGTLDFMAPEQLAGTGPADFRSDVYALGATLYAVLAGQPPFRISSAVADDSGEAQGRLLRRILDEEPPPLVSFAPDAPRELAVIAAKAMEKEPSARYPTADAFAEDLARFQRGEPIHARPPTTLERATRWVRRNRTASRAIAAALAVLVVAAGFSLWVSQRAAAEALEAARLGAEAEQMQELMRVEMLLPAHDLTKAYERIRALMAPLAGGARSAAPGATAFTLGRGHQLLGDDRAAYRELSRAWELGFHRPEAARALGETEGRLYARELASMGRIDDPARKQARLGELTRRYRDPAVARLRGLPAAGEGDGLAIAARVALVERRFDEAAAAAGQALAAGADPLEAGALQGEAQFLGAVDRLERGDTAGATALLATAALTLQRVVEVGRSAPAPRLLLARVRVVEFDVSVGAAGFRLAPLDAIVPLLREAEALNPAGVEVRNVWSGVERRRGVAISAAGGDALPALRAAMEQAERAVAAATSDPRQPLLQVANASNELASEIADRGGDPRPIYDQGIAAAGRARDLSPEASGPVFNLAQLRASRASWSARHGEDAREGAAEAVADGRRFLELGERPVVARVVLAEALRVLAEAQWEMGGDAGAPLAEALAVLQEAGRLAPAYPGVLEKMVRLSATWAGQALAEGRSADEPLRAAVASSEAAQPFARGNISLAGALGAYHALRARAELQAGRDPTALLDKAVPLLEPAARRLASAREALGEAELVRAAWARAQRQDPLPALRRAEAHALAAQQLDSRDAQAALLEAQALLALPRRDAAILERARAALDRALALNPRLAPGWLADARLRRELGDAAGARIAVEKAATLQARLDGLVELREALGKGR